MHADRLGCRCLKRSWIQPGPSADSAQRLQQEKKPVLHGPLEPGLGCVCVSSFEIAFLYELEHLLARAVCFK